MGAGNGGVDIGAFGVDCDSFIAACDYVVGDVNGSCSYNGLDITYGVNYFKGGADPIPCADCPPVE